MYEIENDIPVPALDKCGCGCGNYVNIGRRYAKGHCYKGKKFNKEHRENLSKAAIGRPVSLETRKKMSDVMRGKVASEETKLKMSKSHRGMSRKRHSDETKRKMSDVKIGEKNSQWQGGISFEPYSPKFNKQLKRKIKERDNHQCQNLECLMKSKKLSIHHIDYNKQNCLEDNLITLCMSCNVRANHNREYWTEFYKSIILKVA